MSERKCPCEACLKQAKHDANEMKKSGAPKFVINDHVQDILSGLWVQCDGCVENDFETD